LVKKNKQSTSDVSFQISVANTLPTYLRLNFVGKKNERGLIVGSFVRIKNALFKKKGHSIYIDSTFETTFEVLDNFEHFYTERDKFLFSRFEFLMDISDAKLKTVKIKAQVIDVEDMTISFRCFKMFPKIYRVT